MNPVASHWLMQNGQVTSSPIALRAPVPRTSSFSSADPLTPSKRANGARSGLVDGGLGDEPAQPVGGHRHQGHVRPRRPVGEPPPPDRHRPRGHEGGVGRHQTGERLHRQLGSPR